MYIRYYQTDSSLALRCATGKSVRLLFVIFLRRRNYLVAHGLKNCLSDMTRCYAKPFRNYLVLDIIGIHSLNTIYIIVYIKETIVKLDFKRSGETLHITLH